MLLAASPIGISGAANYQSEVATTNFRQATITSKHYTNRREHRTIEWFHILHRLIRGGSGKPDAVPRVRYFVVVLRSGLIILF